MVDIVVTPNNVVAGSNSSRESGTAGELIAAGKAVYSNSTTNKYMLADNNGASAEMKIPGGIALNTAALDQPLTVHRGGDITIGGTMTAGSTYFLGDTPGGICPDTDVGAGESVALIGVAKSTTVLAVGIQSPGVSR